MDRRAGRSQARPVLWTAATVRKRAARGDPILAYLRHYLARIVVILTLMTPLLAVLTYQWAPRRDLRPPDRLVQVALAAQDSFGSAVESTLVLTVARAESDGRSGSGAAPSNAILDRSDAVRPIAWYRVAAAEEGVSPYLLEALHQVESSAAPDGCWPNIEGSGALGPFQFKPSTFQAHAVDGNGDGMVDICGFADSLFSAGAYLKSLGADGDLDGPAVREALARYGTDPDRVLDLARYYRSRDLALTAESPVTH